MAVYHDTMMCFILHLIIGLVFILTTDGAMPTIPKDWSPQPETPIVPTSIPIDCNEDVIDLILISDAFSLEYATHLQLLVQVVDLFSAGQDNLERLRIAMAVSGSDADGRPNAEWVFQLGELRSVPEVKRAILQDKGRNISFESKLNVAVQFVKDSLETKDVSSKDKDLVEISYPDQGCQQNTTHPHKCSKCDGISKPNISNLTEEDCLKPSEGDHITLILALIDGNQIPLMNSLPDLKHFHENEILYIVLIHNVHNFGKPLPCNKLTTIPCIDLETETMLLDHTLSIALCGRCKMGWVGPMPIPATFSKEKVQGKRFDPVEAFRSCYKVEATTDKMVTYALGEMEKCKRYGGTLVNIESERELDFLKTIFNQWCLSNKSCSQINAIVFIGLRRNTDSLGKRFRWSNGRPLIYSFWGSGLPLGGTFHGCSLWDSISGEFVDVGCGQKIQVWAELCEWTKLVSPEKLQLEIPPSPSKSSIQSAIERSELCLQHFYKIDQKIVLVSSQYYTQLPDCSLYINNTGKIHLLKTSLTREQAFSCEDENNVLIQFNKVCDQVQDCSNAKDESSELCQVPYARNPEMYRCWSSRIPFPFEAKCDLFVDCTDKSDEENCHTCRHGLCSDGRCVPQPWLIDGENDCLSLYGPMELDKTMASNVNEDCAFLCNRSECVPWRKLKDGVIDCQGPEGPLDETLGGMERADCNDTTSNEWAPKCIYQKDRLGEIIGCRNMYHLRGCEDFDCPEGYIKCLNSNCIPVHYLWNGAIDCPMEEDEMKPSIGWPLLNGYFKCDHTVFSMVLHPDRVCDGSKDCPLGLDEHNCHVTCAEGFLCALGFSVVDDYDKSKPLASLEFLDLRTRMIDLSHINVSTVFPTISQLKLNYLINLRLSNCSLTNISLQTAPYLFPDLSKLDLSYNLFTNLQEKNPKLALIFTGLRALTLLNLSHNALLTFFDTYSLTLTNNLVTLDLSHTALVHFPKMDPISRTLRYLNLSYTRIASMAAFTFSAGNKLWRLANLDLRGVDLKDVEPKVFDGLTITSDLYSDYFKLCCPQIRGDGIPEYTCHAPHDPFSSCFNLLENQLLRYLVWLMSVASLFGNLAVILARIAAWNMTLQQPYAQLVTQLAVSDFLMGLYLMIIASKDVEYSGEYVWHDISWPHSALCLTAGFLSTVSSEVSSCFILLITVDRYLVIKFPFGQHRLSGRGVITCSILTWIIGLTLSAAPLLPWTKHWEMYSSNAVCLGLPLLAERRPGSQFSISVFIAFNFFLCLCIAFGQLAIYNVASSTRRSAPVSGLVDLGAPGGRRELTPRMKQDVLLARRLATVAFTDLLCWMPIGVLGFMALGGHSLGGEAYAWMAVFVLPVNSALNPLLYSLPAVKNRVVKAMVSWISSIRRQGTIGTPQDSVNPRY